jgi:hypothetical protein
MSCNSSVVKEKYLELMQGYLTGSIFRDPSQARLDENLFDGKFKDHYFDSFLRENGLDVPKNALTMIGIKRMANIRKLAEYVMLNDIEGDFIETGVWKGGASIFMKSILIAHNVADRNVWLADSFEGLPKANLVKYPQDSFMDFNSIDLLKVSIDEVKAAFSSLDLLDNQVKFLKGWFKDTLGNAPIEKLALLRLDGDMYESTMDSLLALYPKLSFGGVVIIDDYLFPPCKSAVHDFLNMQNSQPELLPIDDSSIYWIKPGAEKNSANKSLSETRMEFSVQTDNLNQRYIKLQEIVMERLISSLKQSEIKVNILNKSLNVLRAKK